MSVWVLMLCRKSESTTSPGPRVAGPEVKTMTLEPVFTKQHSKRPRAAEIAAPVDLGARLPDLKMYVE
jgi:hypothetical protein